MQMDELTQQNAALVEQATAASQSMTAEASSLNEMMTRYDFTGVTATGTGFAGSATQAAAPAPAAANSTGGTGPGAARVERRKATRPWANRPPAKNQPAAAPRPEAAVASATRAPVRAVESGKDSNEWQEF
jgi:methyl-accepting chemotaxis protein